MGLAICRDLAALMGGTVTVERSGNHPAWGLVVRRIARVGSTSHTRVEPA